MSDETRNTIVMNFIDMMKQFLTAMREVFPECPKVLGYDAAFSISLAGKSRRELETMGAEAMRDYHTVMAPWYSRCARRDESLLREDIEFLTNLDMQAKWNDGLHPETKSAIWEYINHLNNFCCLMNWTYDLMPPTIMNVITSNATEMAEKIRAGDMTLNDINVMDLSQKIMDSIDTRELEELGSRLQTGNTIDIASIYSMLNNMMPQGTNMGMSMMTLFQSK